MLSDQQQILDLADELIVDNFAGGGGASTGIELALGRHVDLAINHDPEALGMHAMNHPQTLHLPEDVFSVDPRKVTKGRPVGLAWFSPDCKHFSKAKGGKPVDKKIRGLSLVILNWVATARPRVIFMENVEEIQTWGPLLKSGRPDPAHKGRTFRAFVDILGPGIAPDHPDLPEILDVVGDVATKEQLCRGFGYKLEHRILRACEYGTPTIRKRFFMVSRCDGRPIVWPEATHRAVGKVRDGIMVDVERLKPERTAAECIDWHLPCPSIFLTKEEGRLVRCKRPLVHASLSRVAKGIGRYVIHSKKPFLISVTHQGDDRVTSVDEPMRTVTGANRGEKAVVAPYFVPRYGERHGQEPRTMPVDGPISTIVPTANGATLVAPVLAHTAHGEVDRKGKKRGRGAREVTEPLPGVLGTRDVALVAPILANVANSKTTGRAPNAWSPEEPVRTVTSANGFAVVAPVLAHAQHGGAVRPGDAPLHTIAASTKDQNQVIAVHLTKFNTGSVGSEVTAPVPTIPAGSHAPDTRGGAATPHGLVAASVVKLRGDNVGHAMQEPTHTASAGGQHHGVVECKLARKGGYRLPTFEEWKGVYPDGTREEFERLYAANGEHAQKLAAFIAQHNGGFNTTPGHAATEPVSAISSKGSQQNVVAVGMVKYYGTDQDPRLEEPAHTARTKSHLGVMHAEGFVPPLTETQLAGARRVAAFLREYGVEFEGEFATLTVDGITYVIVDIGMRMLTPRELFRAQGFPDSYIIDRAYVVDKDGIIRINPETGRLLERVLTKEAQIRMCGNSVCPPVACALVRANVPELILEGRVAA